MNEVIIHWVVYNTTTSDFPGLYVARRFNISKGNVTATRLYMTDKNIEVIRERLLMMGLVVIPRDPNDDPVILETWL